MVSEEALINRIIKESLSKGKQGLARDSRNPIGLFLKILSPIVSPTEMYRKGGKNAESV